MSEDSPKAPEITATIKDLLATTGGANTAEQGVLPMLTELADKHQQSSVLIQKAMLMLGLAEEFKNTERGVQLKKDAEDFLAYAREIQESDEAHHVVEKAQKFANTVADKYNKHGKELFEQSQHVWEDLVKSGEAQQFMSVGGSILKDWKNYGGSSRGQEIVESLKSKILNIADDNGASLLDLIQDYASNADKFIAVRKKHKETILHAAEELQQVFEEDSEMKEWMDKGKELLNKHVVDKLESLDETELSDKADDTLANIAKKGQTVLSKIQDSDVGKDLLKKGTEVLTNLQTKGDLNPDELFTKLQEFKENPEKRQEVITMLKDTILEYLLTFIPSIKFDEMVQENDVILLKVKNINLEGFSLKSKDVSVTFEESSGIVVKAKNIKCVMKDLEWYCEGKTFPYMSTSGTAEATAIKCRLEMMIKVDTAKRHATSITDGITTTTNTTTGEVSKLDSKVEKALKVFDYDYTVRVLPLITSTNDSLMQSPSHDSDSEDYEDEEEEQWGGPDHLRYISMPYLEVTIGKSWFSYLYNMLLTYFGDLVRGVVEDSLNERLVEKSTILVDMINSSMQEYLPLIASVTKKVTDKAPKLAEIVTKAGKQIKQNIDTHTQQEEEEEEQQQQQQTAAITQEKRTEQLEAPQELIFEGNLDELNLNEDDDE